MSTAPRYQPHYTVDDYRQWEGRWELWDGVAVAMSPSPRGAHAKLLARIVTALANAIEAANCDATVLVEIDWIVSSDTVVRPDATVVCGPEPSRHVEKAPALVVEVLSEFTRDRDTVFKRALYQDRGVPWYVIADPDERTLRVLGLDSSGTYEETVWASESPAVAIALCENCRITIDPKWLFR
jgi:Uma2 family endonuclease